MIYPICAYGIPILKKIASPIDVSYSDLQNVINNMYETMYEASGIGLAAPQVGLPIRLFIVDTSPIDKELPLEKTKKVFINPQILEEYGTLWSYEEGCLSIPGIREDVERYDNLKIKYFDEKWIEKTENFDGMMARVIQHEYDHLEGILFTDKLSSLKKQILKNRLLKISKGITDADYKMKFGLMAR